METMKDRLENKAMNMYFEMRRTDEFYKTIYSLTEDDDYKVKAVDRPETGTLYLLLVNTGYNIDSLRKQAKAEGQAKALRYIDARENGGYHNFAFVDNF